MSDTQHETPVEEVVESSENTGDRERREARARAYQDVSLRAVELLAKAQRAADDAVAEAQAYARDLEETAREQYRQILQRAQESARDATGTDEGQAAEAVAAAEVAAAGGTVDARKLEYVRTYARVAHTQLKAVLGALSDELDRLSDLAEGKLDGPGDEASESPEPPEPGHDEAHPGDEDEHQG